MGFLLYKRKVSLFSYFRPDVTVDLVFGCMEGAVWSFDVDDDPRRFPLQEPSSGSCLSDRATFCNPEDYLLQWKAKLVNDKTPHNRKPVQLTSSSLCPAMACLDLTCSVISWLHTWLIIRVQQTICWLELSLQNDDKDYLSDFTTFEPTLLCFKKSFLKNLGILLSFWKLL